METRPYLPPVLFNSGSKVAIYLAPVHPKGCPRAIAPPFGLILFTSILQYQSTISTLAINLKKFRTLRQRN